MPPKWGEKQGNPRNTRVQPGSTNIRKLEKNVFKPWDIGNREDDTGIVSWMKACRSYDRSCDDSEDEVSFVRHYGFDTCTSIEHPSIFERESLPHINQANVQFTGLVIPETEVQPEVTYELAHEKTPTPVTSRVESAQRVCKSASTVREGTLLNVDENCDPADDTVSLPACTTEELDHTEIESKVRVELPENYADDQDKHRYEGEDCNDEGYDSKISSNEAERTDDFRNLEETLIEREKYLAKTYDKKNQQKNNNTFKWVRDAGVSPSRIIKLSYSQKPTHFAKLGGDKFEMRLPGKYSKSSRCQGIMAASLGNLSPSSLNMRHFREAGSVHLLNYGVPSAKWSYEQNDHGQIMPVQGEVSTNNDEEFTKDNSGDSCDNNPPSDKSGSNTPELVPGEASSIREKTKMKLSRTSPQLSIDSVKLARYTAVPSPQPIRVRILSKRDDFKTTNIFSEYSLGDKSTNSRIPIGDLLPAVEKNIQQKKARKQKRRATAELQVSASHDYPPMSDDERSILVRRDMDTLAASYEAIHGPPAFRPIHSRSPLQRAKDVVTKRIHGHLTHNPDGTETVRVSSPRFQPRTSQPRFGSASERVKVKMALFGSESKLQDRTPSRSLQRPDREWTFQTEVLDT